MSQRGKRTLVDNPAPRRSPRISTKDVEERTKSLMATPKTKRVPTPPRAKKSNLMVPNNDAPNNEEFSEDEVELFPTDKMPSNAGETSRQWQNRLWETLLESKDKGRKQPMDYNESSWSKRNLFALFVLIPLILIFISMLIWNMSQGINMLDGFFDWALNLIKAPLLALLSFSKSPMVKLQGQNIDVDFLIDRILASDKFSELAQHQQPNQASNSGDYEKLVEFTKIKLQDVEKELKASNEALFDQMSKKIDFAESKVKDLKNSHSNIDYDQLRHELTEIKINLEGQGSGDQEILTLKSNVQQLLEKHDDLAKELANCQNSLPNTEQLEQDLKKSLQNALTNSGLITKDELTQRLAQTQENLLTGLESDVLEKVRNDPVIMDKMATLAKKSGQKFSKDDVVNIVHEALTVYDADKTGLFDFALESAGGTIASIRCTETYDVTQAVYHIMGVPVWWERQNPRKVIQPGSSPGQCWAFKGTAGNVVIKLSNPVYVSDITLEHIPKSLSPDGNIASAPKHFEVVGLEAIEDPNPIVLGNFTYDIDNVKNPVQTFKVVKVQKPITYVELKIVSNYGNPEYTCLYRFRVHGSIDNEEAKTG